MTKTLEGPGEMAVSTGEGDATTDIILTASMEFASYDPSTKRQGWGVVSLKAPFYKPTARSPVDIVAVIDRSGSMIGRKIAVVKETLHFLLNKVSSFTIYQNLFI